MGGRKKAKEAGIHIPTSLSPPETSETTRNTRSRERRVEADETWREVEDLVMEVFQKYIRGSLLSLSGSS